MAGRYTAVAGGLAAGVLIASGATEMYFSFTDARKLIGQSQAIQARAAAAEIDQYLAALRAGLTGVSQLPWAQPGFDAAQRRQEFYRLMVLFPAIVELQFVVSGREQLSVSRRRPDRLQSGLEVTLSAAQLALSPGTSAYGDAYFMEQAEPFVKLTNAGANDGGSLTVATVDLRFLSDVIDGLRVDGQILIVDRAGMLVAHTRSTHVLRRLDLSGSPEVVAMRRSVRVDGEPEARGLASTDFDGREIFATATAVFAPGWLLIVEQPQSRALEPALATLRRTVVLLAVAVLVAALASAFFARRLAAPIIRMRQATQRIAGGDFASRVEVSSGDELKLLGHDFNRMAAALEASVGGLEAQIAARTKELSFALEGAEKASAAKTRFLAAASHDLRQPMHSIGLLVTVLQSRLCEPESIQLAAKLQACAALMENLFTSLLDISRLDAGAVTPRLETFAIAELLSRVALQFEPQASAKGIRLRVRASRAIVHTDPGILERILVNLISNAVRYTHEGGVLIGCRRRSDHLAIQVVDTGPGIDPQHLELIFEEFTRLDSTSNPQDKGLGLGLSIVQRSAQVLGHRLNVRSEPTRGSTFEIVLPSTGIVVRRSDTAVSDDGEPLDTIVKGAFIVIVDDDDGNRHAIEATCGQWGCHVLSSGSVATALEGLSRHLRSPDLIVSDLELGPGGDGFAAIDQIRRQCGEPVPAIIVTANLDSQLATKASSACVHLLHKPASAARMLATIKAAISRASTEPVQQSA